MRIALPSNDKKNIFKRSGRTKGFIIIDIDNNGHKVVDYRNNNHEHHHHHGDEHEHGHSHKEIVDSLKDCQYLVVNIIGKHFGSDVKNAGIKIYKTSKTNIEEAISEIKSELSD